MLTVVIGTIPCCVPKARQYVNKFFTNDLPMDTTGIPSKNRALLRYAELNGKKISPTYKTAVCTEYMIGILNNFCILNNDHKKRIRIITDKDIDELLAKNSPIPKGVYYALTSSGLGYPIDTITKVKAGDLVQFWDHYNGKTFGHCGIVRAIDTKKGLISMYSSSPRTDGHGKQIYVLSEYMYFVRLK